VVGLLTGYLTAGFLVCVLQTLPWQRNFLGFDESVERNEPGLRRYLPPDRVWLGMMHHAGLGPFAQSDATTFDPDATFALRYARLRRFREQQ
jgi:hypothetical protein